MRMTLLTLLGLVLSCLTLCTDGALAQCSLTGQWENDLGSTMTISDVSTNGGFSGTYLTAVTSTNKTIESSYLSGYQQLNELPTFGFTVRWNFSDSITVFTGQCYSNEAGDRVLHTTWLLRSHGQNAEDNWMQTRVGYNIFHAVSEKSSMKDNSPAP
ncbi:avidin-like [Mixophyes fleayi]|uniref:avidin-like n=1 Tax=Mixophyes fleayi TaxID=3061075 RepID=UPI003F4E1058